jgi:hypothetical protein
MVQMKLEEQNEQERLIEETRKTYLNTIQETLQAESLGDIKLTRQEKGKIWNAVADINYRSFNGTPTNAFYKKLEDLQVGKTADYNHYLSLVYHAIDPEGFKQKLIDELKTQVSAETAKKLKITNTKPSGSTTIATETSSKPVIKRGFRNPFG